MRQGAQDVCHWDNSSDGDLNYQPNSPSMDFNITTKMPTYKSRSESSSEQSSSEPEFDNNQNQSNNSENFLNLRSIGRKNSDCSSTSSLLDAASVCSFHTDYKTSNDKTMNVVKFDDIIEKIVELKFSPNTNDEEERGQINDNGDVNANFEAQLLKNKKESSEESEKEEDVDNSDHELRARGPAKSQPYQSRSKPYHTLDDWLEDSVGMQTYTPDIDSTAQQILSNQAYSDMITPALDRLEVQGQNCYNVINNGWMTLNNQHTENNPNISDDRVCIPSITVNENSLTGEELLMEILDIKGFQSAQSDIASNANPSPAESSEHWPDSPASIASYNRSHSRASSDPQSPCSSANDGSPNVVESSSRALNKTNNFRMRLALSSSPSSTHSFGDTPSPLNYHHSVDTRIEDQLGNQFGNFSTWCESCETSVPILNGASNVKNLENWCKSYESSGTIVNSTENADDIDNRLRMLEEVIKDDLEEIQVVPKCPSPGDKAALWRCRIRNKIAAKINSANQSHSTSIHQLQTANLDNPASLITSSQNHLLYSDHNMYRQPAHDTQPSYSMNLPTELDNFLTSNYSHGLDNNQFYGTQPSDTINHSTHYENFQQAQQNSGHISSATSSQNQFCHNTWSEPSTFNNFQVPETMSSYKYNHSKKHSDQSIAPWPSLNLPLTAASKRLKEGIDSKEVEKAMKNLLKKSTQELAQADEDGDTMLMCLVGNPTELHKKKAYLVPLVERLGTLSDGLSQINNRGEDALYLAAMNSPQMSYVTGYLGAIMLQKGIDISQKLYQTRGDTLIHAIVANGDSHMDVLAELLALKTIQGNGVFDLSKCNYDGRTPLHVAVEAHDPSGLGVNSTGTVQLLLNNGADSKIKEIKCGNTALNLAVSLHCDPMLIKTLLMFRGFEAVNIPNRNNNTPLHMAAVASDRITIENQMEVCAVLIRAGGLTNIQNHQGKTPLALVSVERKDYIRSVFRKKI